MPAPTTEEVQAVESIRPDDDDVESGNNKHGKVYASDPNIVSVDNSVRARLRRALSTHRFQAS